MADHRGAWAAHGLLQGLGERGDPRSALDPPHTETSVRSHKALCKLTVSERKPQCTEYERKIHQEGLPMSMLSPEDKLGLYARHNAYPGP